MNAATQSLLVDVAGWIGAVLILLAYGLLSSRRIASASPTYQLMNVVGSIGMLINGIWNHAFPSAALNGIWLLIGAVALARLRSAS